MDGPYVRSMDRQLIVEETRSVAVEERSERD